MADAVTTKTPSKAEKTSTSGLITITKDGAVKIGLPAALVAALVTGGWQALGLGGSDEKINQLTYRVESLSLRVDALTKSVESLSEEIEDEAKERERADKKAAEARSQAAASLGPAATERALLVAWCRKHRSCPLR